MTFNSLINKIDFDRGQGRLPSILLLLQQLGLSRDFLSNLEESNIPHNFDVNYFEMSSHYLLDNPRINII